MKSMKVYCPQCRWEPREFDIWYCSPGCGHQWNTFDTCGVCPRCAKVWEFTQCLQCHRMSRHENWYYEDDHVRIVQEAVEKARKSGK